MHRQNTETGREHPNGKNLDSSERRHRLVHLSLLSVLLLGAWVAFALAEAPAGKDLGLFYQQKCVQCHGMDGSAIGPDGKKLKGHDLTDDQWQRNTDDDEMVHTILNGKFFGLAMPKFKDSLNKEEAQRMVTDIIRKSKKGITIGPETTGSSEE